MIPLQDPLAKELRVRNRSANDTRQILPQLSKLGAKPTDHIGEYWFDTKEVSRSLNKMKQNKTQIKRSYQIFTLKIASASS